MRIDLTEPPLCVPEPTPTIPFPEPQEGEDWIRLIDSRPHYFDVKGTDRFVRSFSQLQTLFNSYAHNSFVVFTLRHFVSMLMRNVLASLWQRMGMTGKTERDLGCTFPSTPK